MGHTRSQRAYMFYCLDNFTERYTEQAHRLAKEKNLVTYYRETIRMEYTYRFGKLHSEIFDSNGFSPGKSTHFHFKLRGQHYLDTMILEFAVDESRAREIYNYEARMKKLPETNGNWSYFK